MTEGVAQNAKLQINDTELEVGFKITLKNLKAGLMIVKRSPK